jgi:hypothetical protein
MSNVVIDSSPDPHNGVIVGTATFVASPWANFNQAIKIFNTAQNGVNCGTPSTGVPAISGLGTAAIFTLEVKVQFTNGSADANAICGWYNLDEPPQLYANGFYWTDNLSALKSINDPDNIVYDGNPHDVAASYDGTTVRLFVDGNIVASLASTGLAPPNADDSFWIGTDDQGETSDAIIDEVRWSNICRYVSNYTPATEPFLPDDNTLALYHLDSNSTPSISNMQPLSGPIFTVVQADVNDFRQNSELAITVNGLSATILSRGITDNYGNSLVTFVIPDVEVGSQAVIFTDGTNTVAGSNFSISSTSVPPPPSPITPVSTYSNAFLLNENIYISPTLIGTTYEAKPYNPMGQSTTDRIFLLGHADNIPLDDPYQVTDINQALLDMGNDISSPLYRSLLEAYYSGARDIWLVPVAPMYEYVSTVSQRDQNYYATYYNRLQVAYDLLLDWDLVQIICPIEAPFYDALGIDFLTQLVNHCALAYQNTGAIRLGFIGTRLTSNMSQTFVDTMSNDSRLNSFNDDGKFTAVIVGEGLFNFAELPAFYTGSVHIAAAGQLAASPKYVSMTNMILNKVTSYANGFITDDQILELSNAKLNALWKTTKGERNTPFQTRIMTDNTLAQTGSDFWSIPQIRLVGMVINDIRNIGNMFLGTVGFGSFQQKINNYFLTMYTLNYWKSYNVNVVRDPTNSTGVLVNVSITPYLGVRQIIFTVVAGPS